MRCPERHYYKSYLILSKQKLIDKCCICNSQTYHFMNCNGKTKMCKKIGHPGGCWIFRIQVENLTRGNSGGLRPPSELFLHILFKLYIYICYQTFINLSAKIQNWGAKIFSRLKSKIVEIQF